MDNETSVNVRVVVRIRPLHETEESCQNLFQEASSLSLLFGSANAQRTCESSFRKSLSANTSCSSIIATEASSDAEDASALRAAFTNPVLNRRFVSKLKPPRSAFSRGPHQRTRKKLANTIMYDTGGAVVNYHLVHEIPFRATASADEDDDCKKCGPSKLVSRRFHFDAMLGPSCKQEEVYQCAVGDAVKRVCSGFHATILAYGQAGSGKTYTIGGGHVVRKSDYDPILRTSFTEELTDDDGVNCRAMCDLFKASDEVINAGCDVEIKLSCLEIHHDELKDLLVKDSPSLHFRDQGGLVQVLGLTEIVVCSIQQVRTLMDKAAARRAFSITKTNERSSRSHSITTLTVKVTSKNLDSELNNSIVGKLTLVDLAGSERIKDTEKVGAFQQETIKINKDLFVLGKVISALSKREKRGQQCKVHIPYRDSVLTRMLRDSLGGNCSTILIACVSASRAHIKQSINTLRFAERARAIKNSAERNLLTADCRPQKAVRGSSKCHEERKRRLSGRIVEREIDPRHVMRVSNLKTRTSSLRLSSVQKQPREQSMKKLSRVSARQDSHPEQKSRRSAKPLDVASVGRSSNGGINGSNRISSRRTWENSGVHRIALTKREAFASNKKLSVNNSSGLGLSEQPIEDDELNQISSTLSGDDEGADENESIQTDDDSFDEFLTDLLLQCESGDDNDVFIRRVVSTDSNLSSSTRTKNSSNCNHGDYLCRIAEGSVDANSGSNRNLSQNDNEEDGEVRTCWTSSEGSSYDKGDLDESVLSYKNDYEDQGIQWTSSEGSICDESAWNQRSSKFNSEVDFSNEIVANCHSTCSSKVDLNRFKETSADHRGFKQASSYNKYDNVHDDLIHANGDDSPGSCTYSKQLSSNVEELQPNVSRNLVALVEATKVTDLSQTTANTDCESVENDSRDGNRFNNLPPQAETMPLYVDDKVKMRRCGSQSTCSSLADDSILSDVYDLVEIEATPVNEHFPACKCEMSIFSGKKQHVEFYLPRISIFCACGKHESEIEVNDDPFALENFLRPWQVAFMKSHGIHDAVKLRVVTETKSGKLVKKMRRWRKRQGLAPMDKMPCIIALHIWARTCLSLIRYVEEQKANGNENPGRPHFMDFDVTGLSEATTQPKIGSEFVR